MRAYRWTTLAAMLLALAACSEVLKAGRCNQTSDCVSMSSYGAGYVCNLDLNPQGNGRCIPKCTATSECEGGRVCDFDSNNVGRCLFPTTDGGVDGMDGGDGGPDTQMCPVCSGSTPVCVGFTCVECAASSDCSADPTKPVCDTATHTCGPCTADTQCAGKLGPNPGVCMAHQDGRCATDAETVYVQTSASCSDAGGGKADAPFCSMAPVQAAIGNSDTRTLVLVRGAVNSSTAPLMRNSTRPEASIIGQQNAVIAGAPPALDIRGGLVYARDLKFSSVASTGISAVPSNGASVTIRLEHVVVDSCQGGGILLDGAAFDIRNTTVTNNGPGQQGTTSWGGILVNAFAPTGSKTLTLVTIENNKQVGLACAGLVTNDGVFAASNSGGVEVQSTCGVTPCSPKSSTCGAQ